MSQKKLTLSDFPNDSEAMLVIDYKGVKKGTIGTVRGRYDIAGSLFVTIIFPSWIMSEKVPLTAISKV